MDIEGLRRFCLSLPHATEGVQWDNDLLFRVGGKMFAVASLDLTPTLMQAASNLCAIHSTPCAFCFNFAPLREIVLAKAQS